MFQCCFQCGSGLTQCKRPARMGVFSRRMVRMVSRKMECGRSAFRSVIGGVCLLACSAFSGISQTPVRPMALLTTRYELRIGEATEIQPAPEAREFLMRAAGHRVAGQNRDAAGLVMAPNQAQDAIVLAASSKAAPGEYTVALTSISETGEERQTTVEV